MEGRKRIINLRKSVVPACDVKTLAEFIRLINQTSEVPGIGAFKVDVMGSFVLRRGLDLAVEVARALTTLPLVLDCQKAGTDIPDLGSDFAEQVLGSGVDAVILFPMAGPETQKAWTMACMEQGMKVISGGEMTHKGYLESDGGYIADSAPERMYQLAAEMGVRDFVVPGNKVEKVAHYANLLRKLCGDEPFSCWAPGFIAQGGVISATGQALGEIDFNAIVGRGIIKAADMNAAAREYTSQIA